MDTTNETWTLISFDLFSGGGRGIYYYYFPVQFNFLGRKKKENCSRRLGSNCVEEKGRAGHDFSQKTERLESINTSFMSDSLKCIRNRSSKRRPTSPKRKEDEEEEEEGKKSWLALGRSCCFVPSRLYGQPRGRPSLSVIDTDIENNI